MLFEPRPKQQEVLDFKSGKMGVSAVPGSGKTRTLSYLAANLVASGHLADDQEVMIVTLVNAAVEHFSRQVGAFVKQRGLLPNLGYRVRTLHGLANDIVRERPALVGLQEGFQIVAEREADDILQDAVNAWLRMNPDAGLDYIDGEFEDNKANAVLKNNWPDAVKNIASNFIKQAKDWQLTPDDIRRRLDQSRQTLPLAEMCQSIYVSYQRGLSYRGAVDFQDLIRLALRILQIDDDYLQRLRHRWPYILEDEAQDSSLLQERILRLLVGPDGNWVRVGDPNQAIYETFTTARPEFLRNFLAEDGVQPRELPNSGRSTQSIIRLANFLIDWSLQEHPVEAVRERKPLDLPYIEVTPPGDPQPNPPDNSAMIHLWPESLKATEEISIVVRSLREWLPKNQDKSVAVLVPRNDRGAQMVKALKAASIDVVELLRSTSSTRETAGAMALIMDALANPSAPAALALAYTVWRRDDRDDAEMAARLEQVAKVLRGCKRTEDFLWPQGESDWLEEIALPQLPEDDLAYDRLVGFRALMRRWQAAVVLPVDQLILTIAQDVFITAADLAIAHSLAVHMRREAEISPHWRLPEFVGELKMVAQNKRRLIDLGENAEAYDPDQHKGKVTVATMHSAKGLEWDRVYLMSVNNYDFPSAEPHDRFISERWFIRDKLNLEAEALAQLACLQDDRSGVYREGEATRSARAEYAAERVRLLYVGITRARQELIVTWNTGRDGELLEATPLVALRTFWEQAAKEPPPKKKRKRKK